MSSTQLDPWAIALDEFPLTGTSEAKLRAALRSAILAPSSHNSQPWLFRISGETLELYADRTRALPVVDPEDRELLISCGACLKFLRLTLTHYGESYQFTILPDPSNPDLLARLELRGPFVPKARDHELFAAIRQRRTNRFPFKPDPVPETVLGRARAQAEREKVWLQTLTGEADRSELAEMIALGDQMQLADRRFRRELSDWVHGNHSSRLDGMPGFAHGVGDLASEAGPLVIRTFDIGNGKAARDRQLVLGSPALAVFWTEEDTPAHWLAAGQGLAGALLSLQADGIAHSYLNQAMEVAELRQKVKVLLGREGFPQLVLRLGVGQSIRPTPRRGVEEVVLNE